MQASEAVDDDIDWWSKYYASIGDMEKCKQYLEYGYDTIQVSQTVYTQRKMICSGNPIIQPSVIQVSIYINSCSLPQASISLLFHTKISLYCRTSH